MQTVDVKPWEELVCREPFEVEYRGDVAIYSIVIKNRKYVIKTRRGSKLDTDLNALNARVLPYLKLNLPGYPKKVGIMLTDNDNRPLTVRFIQG